MGSSHCCTARQSLLTCMCNCFHCWWSIKLYCKQFWLFLIRPITWCEDVDSNSHFLWLKEFIWPTPLVLVSSWDAFSYKSVVYLNCAFYTLSLVIGGMFLSAPLITPDPWGTPKKCTLCKHKNGKPLRPKKQSQKLQVHELCLCIMWPSANVYNNLHFHIF